MPRVSSDWHRLPGGVRVQFIYDPDKNALTCEWAPRKPKSRTEFNRVADKYREARDAFVASLVPGGTALVLE
jgi:hypothetical protein